MLKAISKAEQGIRNGQSPFGACIVKHGKIVSCEHNTVWKDTDITSHAEIHAIRSACRKLGTISLFGCEIYSTCEPCPMCFSAIHWAGISKIYYGASIADAKKAGFRELAISNEKMKRMGKSRIAIVGGVMREECRELFTLFRKASGKKRLY